MATGFSLGGLFRNVQQVQQQPQQQQTPQAPQPTGKPNSSLEAPGAGGQQQQPGQQQPAPQNSPLDAFTEMWKTTPEAQAQNADPFASPLFNMEPGKVNEAINQIDFVAQMDPALVQKAMSGQDPQAFMELLNGVTRKALATSVQLSTATAEQAGQKLGQRFNTAMPARFKDLQIQSQTPTNPMLANPAAAPMLDAVRQRLKVQNPDWTPGQIQQKAEEYFSAFASELQNSDPTKVAERKQQASQNQETDWDQWAQSTPSSSF